MTTEEIFKDYLALSIQGLEKEENIKLPSDVGIISTFSPGFKTNSFFHSSTQFGEFFALISNDSWFGSSAALKQHHAQAILRAVEQKREVMRVSNTGISLALKSVLYRSL